MGLDPITILAGATVAGGLLGAGAASSAADTQAGAANNATQAQRDMFNTTVGLESPFRELGLGAGQKLSYLLGIGPQTSITPGVPIGSGIAPGSSSTPVASTGALAVPIGGGSPQSAASENDLATAFINSNPILNKIHSHYTGSLSPAAWLDAQGEEIPGGAGWRSNASALAPAAAANPAPSTAPTAFTPAPASEASGGQGFGSLLKPFGLEDFQLDPGIQFQMKQGQQALQNSQAAKDGVLSGAALKDLMTFNQGMAGTGYQSAFDRYMANKSFTLGSLMDVLNTGQAAAGNLTSAAPGFSSGIAGSIMGAGNASAAGTIGTANALSGGLSGVGNSYLLSSLLKGGGMNTPGGGVINDGVGLANFA